MRLAEDSADLDHDLLRYDLLFATLCEGRSHRASVTAHIILCGFPTLFRRSMKRYIAAQTLPLDRLSGTA